MAMKNTSGVLIAMSAGLALWTSWHRTQADFPGIWLHFLVQSTKRYHGMTLIWVFKHSKAQIHQVITIH